MRITLLAIALLPITLHAAKQNKPKTLIFHHHLQGGMYSLCPHVTDSQVLQEEALYVQKLEGLLTKERNEVKIRDEVNNKLFNKIKRLKKQRTWRTAAAAFFVATTIGSIIALC